MSRFLLILALALVAGCARKEYAPMGGGVGTKPTLSVDDAKAKGADEGSTSLPKTFQKQDGTASPGQD